MSLVHTFYLMEDQRSPVKGLRQGRSCRSIVPSHVCWASRDQDLIDTFFHIIINIQDGRNVIDQYGNICQKHVYQTEKEEREGKDGSWLGGFGVVARLASRDRRPDRGPCGASTPVK